MRIWLLRKKQSEYIGYKGEILYAVQNTKTEM